MHGRINNETIGISAEVAIADTFEIKINDNYRRRSNFDITSLIEPMIIEIFEDNNIPFPVEHVAEGQNPIDFILKDGSTLSVKSNQRPLGKVAPQIIGQPTAETYFDYLFERFSFDIKKQLDYLGLEDNYYNRSYVFKCFTMNNIVDMLSEYWEHLFECNYYLHFFNVLGRNPSYLVLKDVPLDPIWNANRISFTQTLESWNESNTVKYYGISLGEFQVHRNRNCFKFRFNMNGVINLLEENLI